MDYSVRMNAQRMSEELKRLGHQDADVQPVGGGLTAVVVPMPDQRYVLWSDHDGDVGVGLWSDHQEEPLEFVSTAEPLVVAFALRVWRHGLPRREQHVVQTPDGTTVWYSAGHGIVDAVRPDGSAFRGGPVEWQSLKASARAVWSPDQCRCRLA